MKETSWPVEAAFTLFLCDILMIQSNIRSIQSIYPHGKRVLISDELYDEEDEKLSILLRSKRFSKLHAT